MNIPLIRYEAEWIEKQHANASGEWEPDKDDFCSSLHVTKREAEDAAIISGQRADACEWISVTEQHLIDREWRDIKRWTGDWNGLDPQPTHFYEECA